MKRLVVAAMSLVGVLSPAAAADAPAGFAGSWTEASVHDMQGMDYPDGTPEDWYGGKTMVVADDRLSFADDVCYGPTYTHRRGRLSDVLKAFRKDSSAKLRQSFGVDDAGPFDYLKVHCASGQYLSADPKVPTDPRVAGRLPRVVSRVFGREPPVTRCPRETFPVRDGRRSTSELKPNQPNDHLNRIDRIHAERL